VSVRAPITRVAQQLGRFSPTKASRNWFLIQKDGVTTINSTADTVLLESDARDVDFHSRVSMIFWSRMSTQAAFPVGGEILAIEAYRTVAGVTTAFNYPIYYRAPLTVTGEVQDSSRYADTNSFIHAPGTPVIYGIRARIDSRTTSSVNVRMYGFRLDWDPVVATR
jgi:hypothetical protein